MADKSTRLIAGTPIMVTGTRHHGMRGVVESDKGNHYAVFLDEFEQLHVFYSHQLISYPELQTYESYE